MSHILCLIEAPVAPALDLLHQCSVQPSAKFCLCPSAQRLKAVVAALRHLASDLERNARSSSGCVRSTAAQRDTSLSASWASAGTEQQQSDISRGARPRREGVPLACILNLRSVLAFKTTAAVRPYLERSKSITWHIVAATALSRFTAAS